MSYSLFSEKQLDCFQPPYLKKPDINDNSFESHYKILLKTGKKLEVASS